MPTAQERLANAGYMALIEETTKGTPLTPTTYLPLFKEDLVTDLNIDPINPIVGVKAKNYDFQHGQRTHTGPVEVLAEPNTCQHLFNMLLKAGTITGSAPYTHPYTLDLTTNPKSYTVDILKGQVVFRYWGVEAESIEPSFDKNVMHLIAELSALGSFTVRQIATVSTVTITLATGYDFAAPNKGLVANDLVRIMAADGSGNVLDTTVSAVNADGVTVVLGDSAAAYAPGDLIFLRAATPSLTMKAPFLWSRSEWRFHTSSAASALSAAQTNVEQGSKWKIMHEFNNRDGEQRSGSFDPISLPRKQGDIEFNIKKFFDQPIDLNTFLKVGSGALVVRHFSESGYELRVTGNSIVGQTKKDPLETGNIVYADLQYNTKYNTSDTQAFDVKVINNLSS